MDEDDYDHLRLPADEQQKNALFVLCQSLPFMFIYMDVLNSEPHRMDFAMFLELALGAIMERGGSVPKEA